MCLFLCMHVSKTEFFCSGRRYWSGFLVLPGWQSQLTRTLHHFKKWHCRLYSLSNKNIFLRKNISWLGWESIRFIKRRPDAKCWTAKLCHSSFFHLVLCLACRVKAGLVVVMEIWSLGTTSMIEIQPPVLNQNPFH